MGWYDILIPAPARLAYEVATAPSAEAEATFQKLRYRWGLLQLWAMSAKPPHPSLVAKIPSLRSQWESWLAFAAEWDAGRPSVPGLSAQTADLGNAERTASEYTGPGGPFAWDGTDVTAPDVEVATAALRAATAVEAVALGAGLPADPRRLPLWAWGIVSAAGFLGTLYALTVVRSFLPRTSGGPRLPDRNTP